MLQHCHWKKRHSVLPNTPSPYKFSRLRRVIISCASYVTEVQTSPAEPNRQKQTRCLEHTHLSEKPSGQKGSRGQGSEVVHISTYSPTTHSEDRCTFNETWKHGVLKHSCRLISNTGKKGLRSVKRSPLNTHPQGTRSLWSSQITFLESFFCSPGLV